MQILTIAIAHLSRRSSPYLHRQLDIVNAPVSLSFGLGGRILITGTVV